MKYAPLLILLTISFLFSCNQPNVQFTAEGANYFGEKIEDKGAQTLSQVDIPQNPSDTLDVLLSGTINEVCKAKGCWMTLASLDSNKEIFIRFKDYGFFVPKNADGMKAVVRGKLYNEVTPVEELQHYAKDKGQTEEEIAAITQPKNELRMMADGVIIYSESAKSL